MAKIKKVKKVERSAITRGQDTKHFSISVKASDLKKIDAAAKSAKQSRSLFVVTAALEHAQLGKKVVL